MAKRIKVLLTCQPFRTHVIPFAPLAARLRARGCEVRLASPDKQDQWDAAVQYDIPFAPAGENWTADRRVHRELARTLIRRGNDRFCERLFGRYMAGLARSMADDLAGIVDEFKPDLIVHDCSEFGGYLIGERRGIPTVSADNGLGRLVYELHSLIRPTLNEVRGDLGLGPEPERIPGSYENFITPFPPEFILGGLDIPGLVAYRHENPRRRGERLSGRLFRGEGPHVYVMLGSSGWLSPDFAPLFEHANRVAIKAMSESGYETVVSVGVGNVGKYRPGPNVTVLPYVAQPAALEKARVFIGHGGFGSMRESIAGGTPMVLMPQFADQPDNAERVEEHGLGLKLDTPAATPELVIEAVDHVLENHDRYANSVERVRRAMNALMSLDDLVDGLTGRV